MDSVVQNACAFFSFRHPFVLSCSYRSGYHRRSVVVPRALFGGGNKNAEVGVCDGVVRAAFKLGSALVFLAFWSQSEWNIFQSFVII